MTTTMSAPLNATDRTHREQFAEYARQHGHPTFRTVLDRLYDLWDEWNAGFFAGRLIRPHILLAERRAQEPSVTIPISAAGVAQPDTHSAESAAGQSSERQALRCLCRRPVPLRRRHPVA